MRITPTTERDGRETSKPETERLIMKRTDDLVNKRLVEWQKKTRDQLRELIENQPPEVTQEINRLLTERSKANGGLPSREFEIGRTEGLRIGTNVILVKVPRVTSPKAIAITVEILQGYLRASEDMLSTETEQ